MDKFVNDIKNGKIGIIPTETVLGLCCTFDNEHGIERIYNLKNRKREKKLSVIFENFDQITKNFDINLTYDFKKLAFYFWPGPLTIVIKDNNGNKIGFRKPKSEILLYILSHLDKPLVATSVNFSGDKPAIKKDEINKTILSNVDFIFDSDAGGLKPSTVYDLSENKILRQGLITIEQIEAVLND